MKNIYFLFLFVFFFHRAYGCSGTLSVNSNTTISATTCYLDLTFSNNKTLTVQTGVTLTIDGNVELNNNATIVIESGATMEITGNLTVNNNFTLTNDGTFTVGNFTMNNNGDIIVGGSGDLTVNGNLSAGTNTNIDIDGTTTINGDVNIGGGSTTVNSGGELTITGTYSGPDISGDGTWTLPVDLTSFSAECSEIGYNIVNWVTESELNSDYFLLERSRDGINWLSVNEMSGAGNSVHSNHYEFHDLQSGRYFNGYYRLTQFDYNGDFEVFPIISVSCNENFKKSSLELFPNPNKGVFNAIVYWDDNFSEKGSLQVLNSLGKVLYEEEILLEPGTTLHPINLFGTKAGLYTVIVKSSSQILHQTKVSIN